jgi:acyl-CoA reductase-like NAD-dependent aldehyde dehydrogenase
LEKGFFIQPTIFTNVQNDMRIAQEEIFGPVTCVLGWRDEHEVLEAANASDYGLGGGVWTRDLTRAHRFAREMQTGTVWINRYYNFQPGQPLGGYKQSGFGRENSRETLMHYSQAKAVVVNLKEGPLGLFQA